MTMIAPTPLPRTLRTEPELMGWKVGMPLVTTSAERYPVLQAAHQTVVTDQHGDDVAVNEPAFVPVGTSYEAALAAARSRAELSFGAPRWKTAAPLQSQAVLQATSGMYYVTGLQTAGAQNPSPTGTGGPTPFDLTDVTRIDPSSADPALRAIVGRQSWIAMPGHELAAE